MKLKKFLSLVLCVAMVLSTMSFAVLADGETVIYNLEELKAFRDNVNRGNNYANQTVVLAADIDLGGEEWTPIGTDDAPFNGTFDGGDFTVSNLVITGYNSNVGFFGRTNNGEIKNLTINNANVSGRLNVAAVAGHPYTSKYTNIKVTGDVYVNGMSYVGAVGGKNVYADWTNITVDVNKGSYVNANSVENGTAYRTYVGGVIGFLAESDNNTRVISNVTSNIDVIGSTCDVGGITGIAHRGNSLRNITCSGNVTITSATELADAKEIGGIAGVWMDHPTLPVTFEKCVYTGEISSTYTEDGVTTTLTKEDLPNGGLVGKSYNESGNGTLVKDAGTVDGQLYHKMSDLLAAISDGSDVVIYEGIYTGDFVLSASDVNVVADGDVLIKGEPTFSGTNQYIEGLAFEYTTGDWNINAGGTYKNCSFKAEQDCFRWGYQNGDIIFDGCTFDATGYIFHVDGANGYDVSFVNCDLKGTTIALAGTYGAVNFADSNVTSKYVNIWGTKDGATFENCTLDIADGKLYQGTDPANRVYLNNCTAPEGKELKKVVPTNTTYMGVIFIDGAPINKYAKIGEVYYGHLQDAIDAAADGDVIDLLGTTAYLQRKVIDKGMNLTFKNGTIDCSMFSTNKEFGFYLSEGETIRFEDIAFYAGSAKQGFLYNDGGTVEFVNSAVYSKNVKAPAIFHGGEKATAGTFIFTNTDVTIEDNGTGTRGFLYPTLDITNSNITITGLTDNAMRNVNGTIKDSTVLVDGAEYALKNTKGNTLTLNNTTFTVLNTKNATENAGIYLDDAKLLVKANDAVVNSQIYVPATIDNIAESVSVEFEPTEDVNVYEIYIAAKDDKTINRLSTAQLKFALEEKNDEDISYTLEAAKNVSLTTKIDDMDVYLYNFDGVEYASKTGEKILIGTVKFEGVGTFEFKADSTYAAARVTSASLEDNIVKTYILGGSAIIENQGGLDLDNSTTGEITLAEAKRDVKVVINFNNEITGGNVADYNDMTVTLTGSNGEVYPAQQVGDLVDVLDADGNVTGQAANYTAEKAEMTFNVTAGYRYTVTVEGAGYRTYRYTTIVTEGTATVVINLWNNVKDEAQVVEIGKDSSAVNVTFLAGDIVKDNKINIYDLSAVVSYFGTENLVTEHPEYAKYDLNRDGVIDSKDVAYVLVSWGE